MKLGSALPSRNPDPNTHYKRLVVIGLKTSTAFVLKLGFQTLHYDYFFSVVVRLRAHGGPEVTTLHTLGYHCN